MDLSLTRKPRTLKLTGIEFSFPWFQKTGAGQVTGTLIPVSLVSKLYLPLVN